MSEEQAKNVEGVVLYHRDWDGIAAAWVARRALGPEVRFVGVQYGEPVAIVPAGAAVYILDFSYKRGALEALAAHAGSLVVLDHHKTAAEDLKGLPFARFDMERSGARMAWDFFFPGEPCPALVEYVEDHDLWRFRLPFSREVRAVIRSYPETLEACDTLAERLGVLVHEGGGMPFEPVKEGEAILRYQERLIESSVAHAEPIEIRGFKGAAVNCPTESIISEVGHRLAQGRDFGLVWFYGGPGKWVCSLRSTDGGADVSVLAKEFGGGGHSRAAGFTLEVPPPSFPFPAGGGAVDGEPVPAP